MPIDLTTIFQAIPYVQNVAHAELVNPQAQLAASQAMAQQFLTEQKKQTARVEKQDGMETVSDQRQHQKPGYRKMRPRRPAKPEEAEETQPSNPTPFAGHLVDKKI